LSRRALSELRPALRDRARVRSPGAPASVERARLVRALRVPRRVPDRARHPAERRDARARGRPSLPARPRRPQPLRPAAPESDLAPFRGRGRLVGAAHHARPRRREGPLREICHDEPRRAEPADVGLRPARGSSDADPANRDGRGLEGPEPPRLARKAEVGLAESLLTDAGHLLEQRHHERGAAARLEHVAPADASEPLEGLPALLDALDLDPARAAVALEPQAP